MQSERESLAIVGGGAGGLAAAVSAAQRARKLGVPLAVSVFERDDRVGRSILATGNGRCNFSNLHIDTGEYRNGEFVREVLSSLGSRSSIGSTEGTGSVQSGGAPSPVVEFFESMGLAWRSEPDGRMYPLANKASAVVDVLRAAARDLGVAERCGKAVAVVDPPRSEGKRFTLRMEDGVLERADAVVVACGGWALQGIDVPGLQRTDLRPVLGALKVADADVPFVRELDNIRVRCSVALLRGRCDSRREVVREAGELMFRKYGASGICVFNLSRMAEEGDVLEANLLPVAGRDEARAFMRERRALLSARYGERLTCEDMLRGLVLPRIADAVLKRMGLRGQDACAPETADALADELAAVRLEVEGIADAAQCQVWRGGFLPSQFDPATMGAEGLPGLFAVGEALDVDGPCGGYNLHWAWASGIVAGRAAAESLAGGMA